jgi:YHS domain-containing protein
MATVKDPVCGMEIESESAAARRDVAGQTYYFCSTECAVAFDASPERYATQASATADSTAEQPERLEQHEPPYTTLGFLTSPKFGSAGSGGLEYERLPEAHDK